MRKEQYTPRRMLHGLTQQSHDLLDVGEEFRRLTGTHPQAVTDDRP
jgi:hypothetical protein